MADAREGLGYLLRERDRLNGLIKFAEQAEAAGGIEAHIRERQQHLEHLHGLVATAEADAKAKRASVSQTVVDGSRAIAEVAAKVKAAEAAAAETIKRAEAEAAQVKSAAVMEAQDLRDQAEAEADGMRDRAKGDIQALEGDVAGLTAKADAVEAEVDVLTKRRDALKAEIAAMAQRFALAG